MHNRPSKPSLKPQPESINNDSIVDKPLKKRVSFSRFLSFRGVENTESQEPFSMASSEEFTEVTKVSETTPFTQDHSLVQDNSDMCIDDGSVYNADKVAKSISSVECDMSIEPHLSAADVADVSMSSITSPNIIIPTLNSTNSVVSTEPPHSKSTHHDDLAFLSGQSLTSSLPPLRNYRSSAVDSNLKTWSIPSLHSMDAVHTPLRQTNRNDLSQSTNQLKAYPLDQSYPFSRRRDLDRFLGSLSHQATNPVLESINSLLSGEWLVEFLRKHPFVIPVEDKEQINNPVYADLPENLADRFPELHRTFLMRRHLVENNCHQRLAQFRRPLSCRSSNVLNSMPTSPVAEQLAKMTVKECDAFICQIHKRLSQIERVSLDELREVVKLNQHDYREHKAWEIRELTKAVSLMDNRVARLEEELTILKSDFREHQNVERNWKENSRAIDSLNQEADLLRSKMAVLTARNEELNEKINQISLQPDHCNQSLRNHLIRPLLTIGASSLFDLPVFGLEKLQDEEELSRLLSSCSVECLSSNHLVYNIRTLLGLVSFNVCCTPIPSTVSRSTSKSDATTALTNLIVQSIECSSPPSTDMTPVECSAVESLAAYTIRFFTSQQGSAQLGSRLLGLSLDKVITRLDHILIPYTLLATDLRALYIAKHAVRFDSASWSDQTLLTSTHKKTPATKTHSINSVCPTPGRAGVSEYLLHPLVPPNSVYITITVSNSQVYSAVDIKLTLSSIDTSPVDKPEVCTNVLVGQVSPTKVEDFLNSCHLKPGHLYHAISRVHELLPSFRV